MNLIIRKTLIFYALLHCLSVSANYKQNFEKKSIPSLLSTRELFSKHIYDAARSPSDSKLILVAASGVYKSRDGEKWQKITLFENNNYPVTFAPNGTLYVGPYRSEDDGLSFEQFIRWESLIRAIRTKSAKAPRRIQLEKIIATDERLELIVNVGWREPVQIISYDFGETWIVDDVQRTSSWPSELDSLRSLDLRKTEILSAQTEALQQQPALSKPPRSIPNPSSAKSDLVRKGL